MRRGTDTAVLLLPRPLPGHEFLVPVREVGSRRWGERRHRQEGERHDALGGGERGDGGGGGGYGVELGLLSFFPCGVLGQERWCFGVSRVHGWSSSGGDLLLQSQRL